MLISIVNRSHTITDAELQNVIRAVNRQIAEDFEPYWSFGARLRLEGKSGRAPNKKNPRELRGDAILYLWDEVDVQGALGYHAANALGIPYGFVFTELARKLGESWTVTFSHEVLELVGDPEGNLLVEGPHPVDHHRRVFHWFEMCDAVQSSTYRVDGVEVANFLLPLYFTAVQEAGGRNDFLGMHADHGRPLVSFGVAAGSYVGFYDPVSGRHETYALPKDAVAQNRRRIKGESMAGRAYRRMQANPDDAKETVHDAVLAASMSTGASADPIQHVVVLMLENRSFDHLLGDITAIYPEAAGVDPTGKQRNKNEKSPGSFIEQQPRADFLLTDQRDLDHEHLGAMMQIGSAQSPMSGFIKSYLARYPDATDTALEQVMAYFPFGKTSDADSLPALQCLAREFAVCDHWFSSMLGPTWQNRFFVHSGTCLGHVAMPSEQAPQDMHIYYQETLYDRLSAAGLEWKIYHHGIPQSIVLTRLLPHYLLGRGYAGMDQLMIDVKKPPNEFPAFSFIEPCYFGSEENDAHPPADVRDGDALIAQVYNALRSNAGLWNSTLLIVTYDEHGGFYDHVYPPAAVPPDNLTTEWSFDQLGVRVPAILVSPWVQKGVVTTVFDHTSILRYVCDKWGMPPLGERARQSNSLAPELCKLTNPRTDTPVALSTAPRLGMATAGEPPIEGSREALLLYVEKLPGTKTPGAGPGVGAEARRAMAPALANAPGTASGARRYQEALAKLEALRRS